MALPHAPDSEEVLRAACSGNIKLFKTKQLDDGRGLARTVAEAKDVNERGALFFAAHQGKLELCKYLVEKLKIDVNELDVDGQNPVLHAARQGHTATVKYLIEKGADPAILSAKGTALHNAVGKALMWACSLGREDAVRVLLEHHANVHPKTNNLLPLASAVAANSLPCVELLVKDDIGALDGTHVKARLPHGQEILYIDRKGYPTQNIFVVDFDMCFTSALTGWEGSAHGSHIFREALHRQELNFPHPLKNKYYLVDSRYSHIKGYMASYRGYNMRNIVERTLNVWKSRWPILRDMPYYNIDTQRDIVIVIMASHNYIRKKCNVDNAFQMAENERYIPSVDFDVGTTLMANNIDGKNVSEESNVHWVGLRDMIANDIWAKVYVKPSEATPWRDDEATLLFNAADNGNAEIIKCLLQAGGDPNIIDEHGNKPIQVAAIRCNRAAVKVLLPVTQRILSVPEWSVDGVIEFMQYGYRRRQLDGLFEYMDSYYYSTRVLDLSFCKINCCCFCYSVRDSVAFKYCWKAQKLGGKQRSQEKLLFQRKIFPRLLLKQGRKLQMKRRQEKRNLRRKLKMKRRREKSNLRRKLQMKRQREEEFKKKATDVKARREEECKKNTADAKARREEECKKKAADAKARGEEAFKKKDFAMAVGYYTQGSLVFADNLQAINFDPTDSTLFSNRSLCWIRLGEAEHALCDAKACRKLGPDWAKAYYREANVFYEGLQIDPRSKELVTAFRESIEADRRFHGMSEKNLSSSKS
ncbi:hypothetical protein T459_22166 [Capsicum annuum]|uniref:DDE Tnp4 domain-containing protein n=1 Tax=Capsicum annuum TaxID=4072 RepID=A0A2G2YYS6_CAPAN|nr:putative ankyrin repeat domain-containing protein 17-like isoform X2 [Capsicum annuum]PHT74889.1 hypothetical protein T459_22166 [Capsicum annuum]